MTFADFLEEMGVEDYAALYPNEKLILTESYILVAEGKLQKKYTTEIHYALSDNGDGSARLNLFSSAEEMDRIVEENECEFYCESGDTVVFDIQNGNLTPKYGFDDENWYEE